MKEPRVQEFENQASAVAAGVRTFDEALDILVAAGDDERRALGKEPLAGEDAESFRAMAAAFLRERIAAMGATVRAPTPHEREAQHWWTRLKAEVRGEPGEPTN